MKGSQTENDQQERLLAMLEQKNGEIKHLLGEIKNLEKFKVCVAALKTCRDREWVGCLPCKWTTYPWHPI